ncbi:MAG: hypothetical protein ACLFM6_09750 [Spirochaetaceae bacterium]
MGLLEGLLQKLTGRRGESETGRSAEGPTRRKGDEGIYFYVRLTQTGEIVELRLIPRQELVPDYRGGGYFSRKVITGPRTLGRADALFRFDEGRRFVNAEVSGGELSDEDAYRRQSSGR